MFLKSHRPAMMYTPDETYQTMRFPLRLPFRGFSELQAKLGSIATLDRGRSVHADVLELLSAGKRFTLNTLVGITLLMPICIGMGVSACNKQQQPPAQESPTVTGPAVGEPVQPGVTEEQASKLPPAPKYKPGEPVQVRPDLRESGPSTAPAESSKGQEDKGKKNDTP
jgi:hypothetical protein